LKTELAFDSFGICRRAAGQTEHFSGLGVDLLDLRPALLGPISDAGRANSNASGTTLKSTAAQEAFAPLPA
jgi:hypothetical protein